MAAIPKDVRAYSRTPDFTQATIPAGLLREHSTKAGVWGRIVVLEGSLMYQVRDEGSSLLSPTSAGIVEPEVLHEVRLQGPVRFYVEFLKRDGL